MEVEKGFASITSSRLWSVAGRPCLADQVINASRRAMIARFLKRLWPPSSSKSTLSFQALRQTMCCRSTQDLAIISIRIVLLWSSIHIPCERMSLVYKSSVSSATSFTASESRSKLGRLSRRPEDRTWTPDFLFMD